MLDDLLVWLGLFFAHILIALAKKKFNTDY